MRLETDTARQTQGDRERDRNKIEKQRETARDGARQ